MFKLVQLFLIAVDEIGVATDMNNKTTPPLPSAVDVAGHWLWWLIVATITVIFVTLIYRTWRTKNNPSEPNTKWYWEANREIVSMAIYFILIILAWTLSGLDLKYFSPETAIMTLIPIHFIASVTQKVKLGEVAAVTFFDKVILEKKEEGPVFVPLFTHNLKRATRQQQEVEIPGPSDKLWRGNIDAKPEGKYPVFRVTQAEVDDSSLLGELRVESYQSPTGPDADDKIDFLSGDRYTSEIEARVLYRITKAGDFYRHFKSIEELESLFEDMVKSTLLATLARLTVGTTLRCIGQLNKFVLDKLVEGIETRTGLPFDSLGFALRDTQIKAINLSHDTNQAIAARIDARYTRQTTIVQAQGVAEKTRLEGQAQAEANTAIYRETAKTFETSGGREAFLAEKLQLAIAESHPILFVGGGDNVNNPTNQMLMASLEKFLNPKPKED